MCCRGFAPATPGREHSSHTFYWPFISDTTLAEVPAPPRARPRFHNANQVARRYNWTAQQLLGYLGKHGMHPDRVVNTDFPLSRYQVDLQIAAGSEPPETIQAHAERIFEEFSQVVGRGLRPLAEAPGTRLPW